MCAHSGENNTYLYSSIKSNIRTLGANSLSRSLPPKKWAGTEGEWRSPSPGERVRTERTNITFYTAIQICVVFARVSAHSLLITLINN